MSADQHSSVVILRTSDEDVRRISTKRVWHQITVHAMLLLLVGFACASVTLASPPAATKSLQIYFIDVEAQATLFVTPEGQSLLGK